MDIVFFFTDTETTGVIKNHYEQILDYAAVCVEKGNIIDLVNQEIILKNNILPNPKALLINNINPFTKEWAKKAISENQAVDHFINLYLKYKGQGKRVILIAYNAEFDENMFSEQFERNGKNFKKLVDAIFDPLPLARRLINDKKIKTKEMKGFKGDTYQSAKLEDVYNGLGFSSGDINAHNALEDTKMLATVANKLYYLLTGKELAEVESHPENYKEGECQTIQFLNKQMDLEEKTILVLKNDPVSQTLWVLDSEKSSDTAQALTKAILEISYNQVFDEMMLDIKKSKIVQNFYNQKSSEIKALKLEKNEDQSLDIKNFDEVKKIMEECLNDSKNVEKYKKEDSDLLEKAEHLSYAIHNKGWNSEIHGEGFNNSHQMIYNDNSFKISLNPLGGEFVVLKDDKEVLTTKKKTEVLELLDKGGVILKGSDEYKKINAFLIPSKQFENPKHILKIKEEFNLVKKDVFNGANKFHKEILTDYLAHLKQLYPETFKDVSLPSYKLNLSSFVKK